MNRTGKINIKSDLFLEYQELNRMGYFSDKGFLSFLSENTAQPGPFYKAGTDDWKAIGDGVDSILIEKDSFIYDKVNGISGIAAGTGILIPDDSTDYDVYAKFSGSSIEEGTVTLNSLGVLTGVGTKFTEVLRGNTSIPTRIRFHNWPGVIDSFEVVSVNSDTEIVIAGVAADQGGLLYSVVGAFTPGLAISEDIYSYNTCTFELEAHNPTPPASDDRFLIYTVNRTGTVVTVSISPNIKPFTLAVDISELTSLIKTSYPNINGGTNPNQAAINQFLNDNVPNFLSGVVKSTTPPIDADTMLTSGTYHIVSDPLNSNFPLNENDMILRVSVISVDNVTQDLTYRDALTTYNYTRSMVAGVWNGWIEGGRNVSESIYDNNSLLVKAKSLYQAIETPAIKGAMPNPVTVISINVPEISVDVASSWVMYRKANAEVEMYGQLKITGALSLLSFTPLKIFTIIDANYMMSWPFSGADNFKVMGEALVHYASGPELYLHRVRCYLDQNNEFYILNEGTGVDLLLAAGDHFYVKLNWLGTKI